MTIKLAVLNYEPCFASKGNQTYWQWGKWKDPRVCVQMMVDGWRAMSDGMLDIQVVHWTNVNLFPYSADTNRFDHHRYTEETFTADFRKNYVGMAHYLTCLTADFPHLLAMIDRGEVDHVIFGGGPFFGYWETHMIGRGASACNSGPTSWTNERTFTVMGMNCERPGNGAHPIGHGHGETTLATWYYNEGLPYTGHLPYPPIAAEDVTRYTNINEFVAFTRFKRVADGAIGCGNIHWAPNGTNSGWGYDYGMDDPVLSSADNWNSPQYPHSLTNAPRVIHGREWGLRDEANNEYGFGWWWWNHFPQQLGLYRGHLNNWMTYAWNWNTAAYPLGADQPLHLNDFDLAGWFSFRVCVPPGATQVTFTATSPDMAVHYGLRKNFLPKRFRPQQSDDPAFRACDDWQMPTTSYTRVLTATDNFGRGLNGMWYLTFGNMTQAQARAVRTYSNIVVAVTILPKPTNTATRIVITAPGTNALYSTAAGAVSNIVWQVHGLPQGVRSVALYYQMQAGKSALVPICADYDFNLQSPYRWTLPRGVWSRNAVVAVVLEDVYGVVTTNFSAPFTLDTRARR